MSELFYNRVIRLNTLNDSVYSVNIMLFLSDFLTFHLRGDPNNRSIYIQTLSKMQPYKDRQ